jgi:hypothetical protein
VFDRFDSISSTLGILPGATAKKKPSNTATDPKAKSIFSII